MISREARVVMGITLLTVPTVAYGGLTILGVLSRGAAGLPQGLTLTPLQEALFRAGHAHAGVLIVFSLVLQVLLDHVRLRKGLRWLGRLSAVASPLLLSGGFFGLAFFPAFALLLYLGAASVALSTLLTGVGLLRGSGVPASAPDAST